MISPQSPLVLFTIYAGLFLGVLLAYDGIRQLLSRTEGKSAARNRRMRMIKRGASTDEVLNLLLADGGRNTKHRGLMMRLKSMLRQAGSPFGLFGYWVIVIALFVGTFLATRLALSPELSLFASAAVSLGLPLLVLVSIRKSRLEKLLLQLPDALELMARGLTVGHPLNVTVDNVATDMPDPIGSEFGVVQDQVSYGDDIATAFSDLAERVDLEDARYLAVSVGIQHGTGGNLARVLKVLSKVIRDRATMRRRIRAISSEGRLSALILTLIPFGIFGMIMMTTPSFYRDVQGDPLFMPFAATILGLVFLQGVILNRLVNFKF